MYLIQIDSETIVGFCHDPELAEKAAKWIGASVLEVEEVVGCYTAFHTFRDRAGGLVTRSRHTLKEPVESYKDGSSTAGTPSRSLQLYLENNPDVFK